MKVITNAHVERITFSGHYINLMDFRDEDPELTDIARGLSMICVNPAANNFYSLAEFAVDLSQEVHHETNDAATAMAILLWPAVHAYVHTVDADKGVRGTIQQRIYRHFNLSPNWPAMHAYWNRGLMGIQSRLFGRYATQVRLELRGGEPLAIEPQWVTPWRAMEMWLAQFQILSQELNRTEAKAVEEPASVA